MLRTILLLLLLHALLLQVTAEPAASTAAAAKPKKEKRKKAPKEEVDIFADAYEDEEEEELFPPPSWDEQQMMYEGFVKQDSDGDGEINREDFIEFLAMSLVEELYSHKGIKSEINSGTVTESFVRHMQRHWRSIAKKKRLWPLFFTNLDANKNGHIAWEEFDPFIKAVHRYPHLYKPWKKALKHTRDWVTKRDARHESDMDDLEKMMKGEL